MGCSTESPHPHTTGRWPPCNVPSHCTFTLLQKGDPTNPAKYREIALMSVCCKLLNWLLSTQLLKALETHLRVNQASSLLWAAHQTSGWGMQNAQRLSDNHDLHWLQEGLWLKWGLLSWLGHEKGQFWRRPEHLVETSARFSTLFWSWYSRTTLSQAYDSL